jgi:hypothetical protein
MRFKIDQLPRSISDSLVTFLTPIYDSEPVKLPRCTIFLVATVVSNGAFIVEKHGVIESLVAPLSQFSVIQREVASVTDVLGTRYHLK